MKSINSRIFLFILSILFYVPSFAATSTELTGFSQSNNTAGGTGDVTIHFTSDDPNFGGAKNGGWYVSLELPSGFTTGTAYSLDAACSNATISLSSTTNSVNTALASNSPHCGAISGNLIYIANPSGSATLLANGSTTQSYTVTVRNVTNPSTPGTFYLKSLKVWNYTNGNVSSLADILDSYGVTIVAATSSRNPHL